MYTNAFKLDSPSHYQPETNIDLLDFINKDPEFTVEPFLQGKAYKSSNLNSKLSSYVKLIIL